MGSIATVLLFAATASGVDADLLNSVCYVESKHNVSAYVEHDGGSPSLGMCQVKLATARSLGYTGKPKGLMDPAVNAFYAGTYLRHQYRRYGSWERAVSAFNCGHACGNRGYVNRVMGRLHELRQGRILPLR